MGSKGGFFNLFDWNSKSRKKLFANEGPKQGKKSDDALSTTPYSTVDEEEIIRRKGGSDHSCASSSVDDEGIGVRAPSVVARLMGLESLPTTSVSDPYLSPSYESHTVRQVNYQKRILDPQINGFGVPSKFDGFSRQSIETRQQKMPSSPIDRFRTEALPPKSAKSLPITHHKLLSPIKNLNGFTTSKNAAHIMEAAAKIIEPGLHGFGPKSRTRLLGSSSIPLKVRDPKESSVPQRVPRLVEAQCRQVESAAAHSLRGQALNRSWNGSDDSGDFGTSPDSGIRSSSGVKSKGKSVSLAVQAKVNVQRREATSSSGRSFSVQKDQEESKPNQPPKSQVNSQKNNRQKKTSVPMASSVLRQNNQKQNCSSNREKLSSKVTGSSQHGKKIVSGDASCGKSKTSSRVSGNLKAGLRKDASDMADEKEGFSSRTKNVPRKKRLIEAEFQSERNGINVWVDGREKHVQSNIVIDEHIKWEEDIVKKGTDVVSFTFTSPMGKSAQTPRPVVVLSEKLNPKSGCHVDALSEKKTADLKNTKASSHGLNVMGGDALSILLDRKLRELACGVDLSYCNLVKMGSANTTASFILDTGSTSDSIGILQEKHEKNNLPVSHEENSDGASDSVCSSTNGLVLKVKNKPWESQGTMDFSITSDARKDVDPQNPSPLSILEAAFSNESCNSSESYDSTNGSNNLSSIQSHNFVVQKNPPEFELDLFDSASSAHNKILHGEHVVGNTEDQELVYMKDLVLSAGFSLDDVALGRASETIDPHLFEQLESKRTTGFNKDDESARRKVLFDCARECLDLKRNHYFKGGYKTWAKGVAVVGKGGLAEELYREVSGWMSMGDWMVDELVDKDMSTHLGRWLDFETESFEVGVEIEKGILGWLIDEVVADILV